LLQFRTCHLSQCSYQCLAAASPPTPPLSVIATPTLSRSRKVLTYVQISHSAKKQSKRIISCANPALTSKSFPSQHQNLILHLSTTAQKTSFLLRHGITQHQNARLLQPSRSLPVFTSRPHINLAPSCVRSFTKKFHSDYQQASIPALLFAATCSINTSIDLFGTHNYHLNPFYSYFRRWSVAISRCMAQGLDTSAKTALL
jgi:hypothetical protein